MIVAEEQTSPNRYVALFCFALTAVVALSHSSASAQDFDAVAKRLKKSVKKGELTGEQADVMLGTLKKMSHHGKGGSKTHSNVEAMRKKVEAAVQAGKISREEAERKWEAVSQTAKSHHSEERERREDDERVKELYRMRDRIVAAVKSGKMSQEEARDKWNHITEEMEHRVREERLHQLRKQIEMAVEKGDLSEEEAERKWHEIERRMHGGDHGEHEREEHERREHEEREHDKREFLESVRERIVHGLRTGLFSEEELEDFGASVEVAIERVMDDREEEREREENRERKRDERRDEEFAEMAKKIKAALEAGKITEEEAERKWMELRKRQR